MKNNYVISSFVGLIVGAASAFTFFIHSWLALIPWGIIGLVIGALVKDGRQAVKAGAWYGFFLCAAFLVAGFKGKSVVNFLPLLLASSLIGALCGLFLGFLGNKITSKN